MLQRMVAKPFITEARQFSKKEDARQFFSAMLNRYSPGDKVNPEDSKELSALLKHHTEYKEKFGCGIDHFEVMRNVHNTQSFEIVRIDQSRDDFSYGHCITPKK
jgi:hypothetical protein